MSAGDDERFLPGSTLGILGDGQLGRMIALEARRMGYRTVVLGAGKDSPAGQVADEVVVGKWSDPAAALRLAERCDVVTLETEHIPHEVLEKVETLRPLRPSAHVLWTIQDRLRQKEFLQKHGFPQADFAPVGDVTSLEAAVARVGAPALLKTRTEGYDGKGQSRFRSADEAPAAWDAIGRKPAICEAFVPYEKEVSVVLARGLDDEVRYYALAENVHRGGILHTTRAPARVPHEVAERARTLAADVARALDHVGVMAVEMFLLPDGSLKVNEIAPRVHNSGHYTLGACATSQFEQHLRAVCGLPLGDPAQFRDAVMLNLLGDLWPKEGPDWSPVLATPEAHLHLYGKADARPGRKMAHVTLLHEDGDEALALAQRMHDDLARAADEGAVER